MQNDPVRFLDLFIKTRFFPWKYWTKEAAGYTTSEVPPIISVSALDISFIAFLKVSGSGTSSYKVTSGFIVPLHFGQCGMLSVLQISKNSSKLYLLPQMTQVFLSTVPCSFKHFYCQPFSWRQSIFWVTIAVNFPFSSNFAKYSWAKLGFASG